MKDWNSYYAKRVQKELAEWEDKLLGEDSLFSQASQGISRKVNGWIPRRVHEGITSAVKGMVKSVITGASFIPKEKPDYHLTLYERDQKAQLMMMKYRKIAAVEGAATGAGGLMLGLADFPALLAIKMNMLFEMAPIYGYETRYYRERLYLLHIFQLTYSSAKIRKQVYTKIKNWDDAWSHSLEQKTSSLTEPEWQTFQQEYRDSIDLRKLLQLFPVVGAFVGAWANDGLTKELAQNTIHCYQQRILT